MPEEDKTFPKILRTSFGHCEAVVADIRLHGGVDERNKTCGLAKWSGGGR